MNFFAVIDTNALVSAMLKWNSVPGTVLSFVFDGTITPIFNNSILAEYKNVLERPKFKLPSDVINAVLSHFNNTGIMLDGEKQNIQLPDPEDLIFYEVVMTKRKTEEAYLVTGNIRHFPAKPFVVTPREMLDIIVRELT
jgi:putative PIN family toxin of toxin-antitoxin system